MFEAMRGLILLFSLSASLLLCDVVELKTGERLEGAFRQANSAGVVIEVGGQSINMPLAKVRAIYFGAMPPARAATQTSSVREALQALKGIQSATTVGTNYRDYSTRVADSKVKVDEFVQSSAGKSPAREPIRSAMQLYELASLAWGAVITHSSSLASGAQAMLNEPAVKQCDGITEFIGKADALERATANLDSTKIFNTHEASDAMLIGAHPQVAWNCAAGRVAEAERLMK